MSTGDIKTRYALIKEDLNWHAVSVAAITAVGAFTFGYDLNWWGAMLAHPYFNQVFGTESTPLPSGGVLHTLSATQQSLSSATSSIGTLIGSIIGPSICSAVGYRWSMGIAASLVILGSIVQMTCSIGDPRFWQLAGGKIIITIAVGMNCNTLPAYLNNCAPYRLRGAFVNVYTTVVALAAVVASSTILGLQNTANSSVWMIPVGIQFTTPFITLATLGLIPESPFWLVSKGRKEAAVQVLRKLHPRQTEGEIEREISAAQEALTVQSRSKRSALRACFEGSNLKRTLTVIGLMSLFQAQGLGFVLGYFAVLLVQLGIPNVFTILVVIYVLLFGASVISMFYQDAIGRRAALLCGSGIMAICMISIGAILSTATTLSDMISNAAVSLAMIWIVAFTATWYSLTWTLITEIPATEIRFVSISISNVTQSLVGLIVVLVVPYLQNPGYGNLGARIGYLWGSFSIASICFVYFMVPELRGRPAFEVDWMYQQRIAIRKMKAYVMPGSVAGGIAIPAGLGGRTADEGDEKAEIAHLDAVERTQSIGRL